MTSGGVARNGPEAAPGPIGSRGTPNALDKCFVIG